MGTFVLLAITALLLLVLFTVRSQHGQGKQKRSGKKPALAKSLKQSNQFHAVSILPGAHCCDAAKKMVGHRFLSAGAPRLPLGNCDETECSCKFIHHRDRRSGDDRRSPFRPGFGGDTGVYKVERRGGKDRRAENSDELRLD